MEAGANAVEFAIAAPALILALLGTFQAALLYQARAQVEVATQEVVRAGTLHRASLGAIRAGLARGLTSLYTHGRDMTALAKGGNLEPMPASSTTSGPYLQCRDSKPPRRITTGEKADRRTALWERVRRLWWL